MSAANTAVKDQQSGPELAGIEAQQSEPETQQPGPETQQPGHELAAIADEHSQHKMPTEHGQLPQASQNGPLGRKFM